MTRSFFDWAQMSWRGTFIREATWGFAIVSIFLRVALGRVFLMSLRLLGLLMRDRAVSEVARDFRYWTRRSVTPSRTAAALRIVEHSFDLAR